MNWYLPMLVIVCPEDVARLDWQRSPLDIDRSSFKPIKYVNIRNKAWWPCSASCQIVPAAITCSRFGEHLVDHTGKNHPDLPTGFINEKGMYCQGDMHDMYAVRSGVAFGKRRSDEVQFASQKVMKYDTQQRHTGKTILFSDIPKRPSRCSS